LFFALRSIPEYRISLQAPKAGKTLSFAQDQALAAKRYQISHRRMVLLRGFEPITKKTVKIHIE
jgi:hypothetical protein